jgi:hypothetical protein
MMPVAAAQSCLLRPARHQARLVRQEGHLASFLLYRAIARPAAVVAVVVLAIAAEAAAAVAVEAVVAAVAFVAKAAAVPAARQATASGGWSFAGSSQRDR